MKPFLALLLLLLPIPAYVDDDAFSNAVVAVVGAVANAMDTSGGDDD